MEVYLGGRRHPFDAHRISHLVVARSPVAVEVAFTTVSACTR